MLSKELLAASGLDQFSIVKVAKRAGVSAAAPYRHFSDRDELLAAVATDIGLQLADAFEVASTSASTDPARRLAVTAGAYTRFVVEHGVGLELVFAERFRSPRFESVHAQSRAVMDILLPLAHEASGTGEWSASIRLLESHIALAIGYATQQQNRALSSLALSTEDLVDHSTEAAYDLIKGFQLRVQTSEPG
jgi:AcrR family transcriptional regulator